MPVLTFTHDLNTDIQSLIGLPYLPDGDTPDGFDCFGLVRWLFAQRGVDLPLPVREFRRCFIDAEPPYLPWDVAHFIIPETQGRHCGLITEYPSCVQASVFSNGVARANLTREPWRTWLVGLYRLSVPT